MRKMAILCIVLAGVCGALLAVRHGAAGLFDLAWWGCAAAGVLYLAMPEWMLYGPPR